MKRSNIYTNSTCGEQFDRPDPAPRRSIVCVVASIAFVEWPFGPVEALSIVVFLGYCITFCPQFLENIFKM